MKRTFGAFFAVALVVGIAWMGGYSYWHFRLLGALRTLETQSGPTGTDGDAAEIVREAGCKAVPYLVGSIRPSMNPYFLVVASDLLQHCLQGPLQRGDVDLNTQLRDWIITTETRPEERQKKCDALHAWWREKGEPRHSGAKWWKRDCGGI
ncbi:MAG: hypothetical protein JO332_15605 [Planctomycetaceae bacterium]|nr:hypothetical protein [Planctomycetaceae bacterium]